uniref:Uncharacterized protein n=1 Tax=Ascaris lumbricoides TaxID=6252 RepID=A0A0M3IDY7_ASCLU
MDDVTAKQVSEFCPCSLPPRLIDDVATYFVLKATGYPR